MMDKKRRMIGLGLLLVLCCVFSLSGCGGKHSAKPEQNTELGSYKAYYEKNEPDEAQEKGMAADLAVISAEDQSTPGYDSSDKADLLVNDTDNEIVTSYRCFKKIYPASLTKVMTALLILEKGDFNDKITLEHNIVFHEDGVVVSSLSAGDTVTVDEVFHTMLIKSANDCTVILGEYLAGSESAFVDMMNEKAQEIGATHTHFANTNGLHDPDHYTTAYDLYLIFNEAVKYDRFVDTISSKDYTMTYTNSAGVQVNEYMQTTNHYLLNDYPTPGGVVMYGGKTGTTSAAGSNLILMTENKEGKRFFAVALGAKTKDELYASMSALLAKTNQE